jgi:hypothetical protein
LTEDFGVSAADLAYVDVDRILALQATSPEQLTLIFCAKPERDAYLIAARLAFEDKTAFAPNRANEAGVDGRTLGSINSSQPVNQITLQSIADKLR